MSWNAILVATKESLIFCTHLSLFIAASSAQLAIEARVGHGAFSSAWAYAKRGESVTLRIKSKTPVTDIVWTQIDAVSTALDNTAPSFHFEPVSYRTREVERCLGAPECVFTEIDAPQSLPVAVSGLGTAAFQVSGMRDGVRTSSPGMDSTENGGLSRRVFRVAYRLDDTPLGFATELLNTPYIFGSDGAKGAHQSDFLIGSDCADLVIYGQRRAGTKATYTSSYGLSQQAPPLTAQKPVQRGDVVHFPHSRHVGLLFEDRPPLGVLDGSDLILHTCWAQPTIEAVSETRCASLPYRVLRFPKR